MNYKVDIIHLRGYPVEVHHVTTQDGYILELHRIPTSPKSQLTGPGRRAVFLQHGIFASDFVWVTAKTENALGIVLEFFNLNMCIIFCHCFYWYLIIFLYLLVKTTGY